MTNFRKFYHKHEAPSLRSLCRKRREGGLLFNNLSSGIASTTRPVVEPIAVTDKIGIARRRQQFERSVIKYDAFV